MGFSTQKVATIITPIVLNISSFKGEKERKQIYMNKSHVGNRNVMELSF
jgi:hypothetical protein